MEDIVDRLETVKRNFERALIIGAGDLVELLTPNMRRQRCGPSRTSRNRD